MSTHLADTENPSQLYASAAFRLAHRVCIYLSMATEVDTVPILRTLFRHNKHVYIPCYVGDSMEMVRLLDMADYERLPLTKWQIRQPDAEDAGRRETASSTGGLDLIVVPGVAFSGAGRRAGVARLGHGMGYYDRYLHRLFGECPERAAAAEHIGRIDAKLAAGQTVLVGLAFGEQMVGAVPMDEHDVLLDEVLTTTTTTTTGGVTPKSTVRAD